MAEVTPVLALRAEVGREGGGTGEDVSALKAAKWRR